MAARRRISWWILEFGLRAGRYAPPRRQGLKSFSDLLLEHADLLGNVAEVDVLAVDLGISLQCVAGVARLFVSQAQIILQGQDRLLIELGCLERTPIPPDGDGGHPLFH